MHFPLQAPAPTWRASAPPFTRLATSSAVPAVIIPSHATTGIGAGVMGLTAPALRGTTQ